MCASHLNLSNCPLANRLPIGNQKSLSRGKN
nr:MAG TPA: hypothetical protein [Inoviridae sp.]